MKLLKTFFLCCVLWHFDVFAVQTYGDLFVKTVTKVHDGDTFKANIDNIHPLIGEGILIRIWGIDTPEITSKKPKEKALALKARDFVIEKLAAAKKIQLCNVRRDKYFRILSEVIVDGKNLGDELIEAGYAKPYFGGTKPK